MRPLSILKSVQYQWYNPRIKSNSPGLKHKDEIGFTPKSIVSTTSLHRISNQQMQPSYFHKMITITQPIKGFNYLSCSRGFRATKQKKNEIRKDKAYLAGSGDEARAVAGGDAAGGGGLVTSQPSCLRHRVVGFPMLGLSVSGFVKSLQPWVGLGPMFRSRRLLPNGLSG